MVQREKPMKRKERQNKEVGGGKRILPTSCFVSLRATQLCPEWCSKLDVSHTIRGEVSGVTSLRALSFFICNSVGWSMPQGPSTPDTLSLDNSESSILFFSVCTACVAESATLVCIILGSNIWPRQLVFHYKLTYSLFPCSFLLSLQFCPSLTTFPPSFNVQLAFLSHAKACARPCRYISG